jgi:hypothetical protein
MRKYIWVIGLLLAGGAWAQDTTATRPAKKDWLYFLVKEEYGKNIIKYNVMPTMMFVEPRNVSASYERVIIPGQSITIGAGHLSFPGFTDGNVRNFDMHVNKNAGFTGCIDYRFYLKKHNKRPAPNGVYIAPFYSIYKYNGNADFVYEDDYNHVPVNYQVNMNTNFVFHNFGFELGYQFIFFKRLTLDMILFGPAYSIYKFDIDVKSNMSEDTKSRLIEQYADGNLNNMPVLKKFIEKSNFEKSGSTSGYAPNFRYAFQFGWHF